MRIATLGFAIALAATAANPARAADPVLKEATDLAGLAMFINSGAPGMVLVVTRGNNSIVLGYGETEKGNNRTPDGNSLLRLNSITKVFTTEALARYVADGKLRLTDPLQRYAANMTVPTSGERPITLLDLATHSAALPREMGDAPSDAPPRTWPTHADRWTWLGGFHLPWVPGTIAAYSNVGFDLLADAIETAAGQTYPDLLRARVTGPLGMADTGFAPTPEQCGRLMIGSGLGGAWSLVIRMPRMAAAASTARQRHGTLAAPQPRGHDRDAGVEPRRLSPAAGPAGCHRFRRGGTDGGSGLGWVIVAGRGIQPTLEAKSGGGVGFMSYVAFAPGRDVGLFVAVNRVDFAMFYGLVGAANGLIANFVTR